jgi:dipeptidyl aminopeptidase/acylaminoacyl peptidase
MNIYWLVLLTVSSLALADKPDVSKKKSKATASTNKTATLTVEQALALSQVSDLQFSPDGRRLAFNVTRPSKGATRSQEIWMLDVITRRLWRFTHSPKADRMPRWSPEGARLAFLSDRDERAQVYLMPTDGGEAERLTDGKNAVVSFEWSPDGKHIAFLAPEPKTEPEEKKKKDKDDARIVGVDDKPVRLWVVEIASKKVRQLTTGKWQIAEMRWAPQGDRLFVVAAEHPASHLGRMLLSSVALTDGTMKEILKPAGFIVGLQVSPDGTCLTFVGPRGDGPAPHDLFLQALASGLPRNLTSTSLDRPIQGAFWQRDGQLVVVAEEGFKTRCFRLALDGHAEPLPATEVNPFGRVVRNESGVVAFVGQTATDPPEVWLIPNGGQPERVTHFNDSFQKLDLVHPEFYRYVSFDKTEIEAALYRPRRLAKEVRVPLVVLAHGGPTFRWSDSFDTWAQLLAARGIAVFCPNIRGSTGYGWNFLVKNRADWGGGDFRDLMAGVDELISRGVADPNRLGIGGWSYGGYMAAWAITQTPRFKASVVGAGMSYRLRRASEGYVVVDAIRPTPSVQERSVLSSGPTWHVRGR